MFFIPCVKSCEISCLELTGDVAGFCDPIPKNSRSITQVCRLMTKSILLMSTVIFFLEFYAVKIKEIFYSMEYNYLNQVVFATELPKMEQCLHSKGYCNVQKLEVSLKFKLSKRYAPCF